LKHLPESKLVNVKIKEVTPKRRNKLIILDRSEFKKLLFKNDRVAFIQEKAMANQSCTAKLA